MYYVSAIYVGSSYDESTEYENGNKIILEIDPESLQFKEKFTIEKFTIDHHHHHDNERNRPINQTKPMHEVLVAIQN